MDTVQKFSSLFQGRTDFLGAEEGGCVRISCYDQLGMEWIYQGHLTGSRPPIGIYPVTGRHELSVSRPTRKQFMVKFGAVDIDFEDLTLATNIWKALSALGIDSWVERSRSKGYHVWVFADEWVPSVLMRSALQVACEVVRYQPKEIYPKQTELVDGSPGNYIRLPYPGALLVSGAESQARARRVVLEMEGASGTPLLLEDFVRRAWENRVGRSVLESAASLAKPPRSRPRLVRDLTEEDHTPLVPAMGGLSYSIWKDGPLEGSDRSSTLFKLAHSLKKDGFTVDQAFSLVRNADGRWGKFADRADGDQRLWEILERVYDE